MRISIPLSGVMGLRPVEGGLIMLGLYLISIPLSGVMGLRLDRRGLGRWETAISIPLSGVMGLRRRLPCGGKEMCHDLQFQSRYPG